MEGSDRAGLELFRPTWMKMVLRIANVSVQLDTGNLDRSIIASWELNPQLAYDWVKEKMKQGKHLTTSESDHAFSDYGTLVEELSPSQKLMIGKELKSPEFSSISARRWVYRSTAKRMNREIMAAQGPLATKFKDEGTSEEEKEKLEKALEQMEKQYNELRAVYLENGGKMDVGGRL